MPTEHTPPHPPESWQTKNVPRYRQVPEGQNHPDWDPLPHSVFSFPIRITLVQQKPDYVILLLRSDQLISISPRRKKSKRWSPCHHLLALHNLHSPWLHLLYSLCSSRTGLCAVPPAHQQNPPLKVWARFSLYVQSLSRNIPSAYGFTPLSSLLKSQLLNKAIHTHPFKRFSPFPLPDLPHTLPIPLL